MQWNQQRINGDAFSFSVFLNIRLKFCDTSGWKAKASSVGGRFDESVDWKSVWKNLQSLERQLIKTRVVPLSSVVSDPAISLSTVSAFGNLDDLPVWKKSCL